MTRRRNSSLDANSNAKVLEIQNLSVRHARLTSPGVLFAVS